MKLEDTIQASIEDFLDSIGHDEPLPTYDEAEAKKLLMEISFANFSKFECIDARDSASLYKALIDLIRARQGDEISFMKKHMFD